MALFSSPSPHSESLAASLLWPWGCWLLLLSSCIIPRSLITAATTTSAKPPCPTPSKLPSVAPKIFRRSKCYNDLRWPLRSGKLSIHMKKPFLLLLQGLPEVTAGMEGEGPPSSCPRRPGFSCSHMPELTGGGRTLRCVAPRSFSSEKAVDCAEHMTWLGASAVTEPRHGRTVQPVLLLWCRRYCIFRPAWLCQDKQRGEKQDRLAGPWNRSLSPKATAAYAGGSHLRQRVEEGVACFVSASLRPFYSTSRCVCLRMCRNIGLALWTSVVRCLKQDSKFWKMNNA